MPRTQVLGILAKALEQGRGQGAGLGSSESLGHRGPEGALGFIFIYLLLLFFN